MKKIALPTVTPPPDRAAFLPAGARLYLDSPDFGQRAPISRKIEALQTEEAQRNRNAARQPQVHEQIEQSQVAGPRIPERQP